MSIKSIINDLVTEADGLTHCPVRYIALGSGVTALAMTIADVLINKHPFDIQQFGVGTGSLLAGIGGALKLKPDAPAPGQGE